MGLKAYGRLGFGLLVCAVSGCAPHLDYRGKFLEKKELAQIAVGQSDREDVLAILGSPSAVDGFYDPVWIYDYQVTEKKSFFDPKVLERQIVAVHFDDRHVVKSVHVSDKGAAIDPSPHTTPTLHDDKTVLSQVFGNFGRASRKELEKESKK